jgi:L-rhamnose mutarotase
MPKVLFTISYDIRPEKREEYLQLARDMKAHLADSKGKNYAIYEQKGKKNGFFEMFVCASQEEFDKLEDDQDDILEQMVARLDGMLLERKMKYVTFHEVA